MKKAVFSEKGEYVWPIFTPALVYRKIFKF